GSQRGAVVHGGTYTANLIGLSAAQATLAILSDTQALHTVHQAGQQVKSLLSRVFTRAGWRMHLRGRLLCWAYISPHMFRKPTAIGARPIASCTTCSLGS
ncbi:MAG: aminotransferase class III-fold pyridoxal phosphate-dependent enzyme, partial [Betaproteobacteria bacterium]|nr:aminotransferase class III-fold pyridoxal phosphate-dependent enzyme [Betaproteobacteria bacterium]